MAEAERHDRARRRLNRRAAAGEADAGGEEAARDVHPQRTAIELGAHRQPEFCPRLGLAQRFRHARAQNLERRRHRYFHAPLRVVEYGDLRGDERRADAGRHRRVRPADDARNGHRELHARGDAERAFDNRKVVFAEVGARCGEFPVAGFRRRQMGALGCFGIEAHAEKHSEEVVEGRAGKRRLRESYWSGK